MAVRVRKGWLVLAVAIAALLGWAWHDGGEQPLRLIAEPVALPPVVLPPAALPETTR